MLYKTSTRWQDFLSKLSPTGKWQLENSGLFRPRERFITGYNDAVDHIVNKHGYTPVDITGPTDAQYEQAMANIYEHMQQNILNNNVIAVERDRDAVQFLDKYYTILRKYPNGKSWADAKTLTNAKIMLTENMNVDDIPGDKAWFKARVRGHEALEVNEGERLLPEFYTDPERVVERAKELHNKKYHSQFESYADRDHKNYDPARLVWYANRQTGRLNFYHNLSPNRLQSQMGHIDLRVPLKERKIIDTYPYQNDPAVLELRKWRTQPANETDFINSIGNYSSETTKENFGKLNYRQALHTKQYPIVRGNIEITPLDRYK